MATVISVHSFRGGTGKSNTTANLAAIYARAGRRVGVIDTDIQSPGIHVLFGLAGDEIEASLNDFLWHGRAIEDVARDVTSAAGPDTPGRIHLIPSSMKPGEIARVLREGYDAQRMTEGFRQLIAALDLDILLIDTHPGLNEETLLSLVLSDSLLIVMRPDRQDYEGTGVTARVARELEVPRIRILVNKLPDSFDAGRGGRAGRGGVRLPRRRRHPAFGRRHAARQRRDLLGPRSPIIRCRRCFGRSRPPWSAMAADDAPIFSRAEVTGGMPARRASTLLYAIEARTALLTSRARRAMARFETERTAAEHEGQFLSALAEGRSLPTRPTIQDLDRQADRGPASSRRSRHCEPRSCAGSSRSTACRPRPAVSGPRSARTIPLSTTRIGADGHDPRRGGPRSAAVARAPSMATGRACRTGSSRCRRSGSRSP